MRALEPNDIEEVYRIWKNQYSQEFEFPELDKFLCAATFLNDDNHIISAGGIRLIPEIVLVTDKNFHARKRWFAIQELLQLANYVCVQNRFIDMHAFVQDKNWQKHLGMLGFRNTIGTSMVRNTTNG